jgi:hypothetical protein
MTGPECADRPDMGKQRYYSDDPNSNKPHAEYSIGRSPISESAKWEIIWKESMKK